MGFDYLNLKLTPRSTFTSTLWRPDKIGMLMLLFFQTACINFKCRALRLIPFTFTENLGGRLPSSNNLKISALAVSANAFSLCHRWRRHLRARHINHPPDSSVETGRPTARAMRSHALCAATDHLCTIAIDSIPSSITKKYLSYLNPLVLTSP